MPNSKEPGTTSCSGDCNMEWTWLKLTVVAIATWLKVIVDNHCHTTVKLAVSLQLLPKIFTQPWIFYALCFVADAYWLFLSWPLCMVHASITRYHNLFIVFDFLDVDMLVLVGLCIDMIVTCPMTTETKCQGLTVKANQFCGQQLWLTTMSRKSRTRVCCSASYEETGWELQEYFVVVCCAHMLTE